MKVEIMLVPDGEIIVVDVSPFSEDKASVVVRHEQSFRNEQSPARLIGIDETLKVRFKRFDKI